MLAVVTGATKGIGWEISKGLVARGYDLALCARNEELLQTRVAELRTISENVSIYGRSVDVSHKSELQAFGMEIQNRWERLDVLVNNAGVFLPGAIHEESDGTLEKQIETNLYSAYHLTRKLLSMMLPFGQGLIVNMCSIASIMAYPNGGSYSISKFALLGFSKVLREELKTKGIKVTSVLPGATWSDSWSGATFPYERLMETQDIAKAVLSLLDLSDSAVVEEIIIRPQLGDL